MAVKKKTKKATASSAKKKATAKKKPAKKAAPKKTAAKKKVAKKAAPKKTAAKKAAPKKATAKKAVAKKTVAKKAAPKKTVAKKAAPKKVVAKKVVSAKAKTTKATTKPVPKPKPVKKTASVAEVKVKKAPAKPSKPLELHELAVVADDDYMNAEMLEQFKTILQESAETLTLHVIEAKEKLVVETNDVSADLNDRATLEENFSLELRERDRERKLLKKISASLEAIESGDYGYCIQCGVPIGYKRLLARPVAVYCIDCKSLEELKERHRK